MKKIHIDRLDIHLDGVSARRAHEAAAGLGAELLAQLRGQDLSRTESGHIPHLEAGSVTSKGGAAALRRDMAEGITRSLRGQGSAAKEDRSWRS